MPLLAEAGLATVALAALFGWVVYGAYGGAPWLGVFAISRPRRLLQAHLEWLIMGGLFMAAGATVASPPAWIIGALLYGGVVAPSLFIPLARSDTEVEDRLLYRVLDKSSLVALSGGWLSLAIYGIAAP